jgi:hypothetical protein
MWAKRPGLDSLQDKIFLFSTAPRPAVGSAEPPIQLEPGDFHRG